MTASISALFVWLMLAVLAPEAARAQANRLVFGDTHLHTMLSLDAFTLGNRSADPDMAYRYAKGLPIVHPGNHTRIQIHTPLDLLIVTDHAEYAGAVQRLYARDPIVARHRVRKEIPCALGAEEPGRFTALSGWDMSAAGLTGVWTEANARAAITAAFKRGARTAGRDRRAGGGPMIRLSPP